MKVTFDVLCLCSTDFITNNQYDHCLECPDTEINSNQSWYKCVPLELSVQIKVPLITELWSIIYSTWITDFCWIFCFAVQKNSMKTKCSFYIKLFQLSAFSLWMIKLEFQWKLSSDLYRIIIWCILELAHLSLEVKQLQQPPRMMSVSVPLSLLSLTWLTGVSRQPNGLRGSSFFFLLFSWGTKTKIQWVRFGSCPLPHCERMCWRVHSEGGLSFKRNIPAFSLYVPIQSLCHRGPSGIFFLLFQVTFYRECCTVCKQQRAPPDRTVKYGVKENHYQF